MTPRNLFTVTAAALALTAIAIAQRPPAWHDELIENFAGTWTVEGNVVGRPAHHIITADWIMDHHFLQVHERTSRDAASGESPYDALWFLGYDDISDRYVLHLIDVFGGRFSETLGYGTRHGNQVRFDFEYGDGPFHNTWRWLPESKSWEWHLEQKDSSGKWKSFADYKLTRISPET